LTESLIANFLPTPSRLGRVLAVECPLGSGQESEDNSWFLITETGFNDKSAELNLAPGIEPTVGINYPLHLNPILE
jgi:hypothetical protein